MVKGLLEVDPEGLRRRFTVGYRRASLLTQALEEGSCACVKALLDLGAGVCHLRFDDANPFAMMRPGLARAANAKKGKAGSVAPAQVFSMVARCMVKSLMARGAGVKEAKLKVEELAAKAGRRLIKGNSKAAYERLLLDMTIDLARLGADGEQVAKVVKAKSMAARL